LENELMPTEELILNEASCCECKKPISSIPSWLCDAKVKFQCEECRQKHPRIPGMAELDPRRTVSASDEMGELDEVVAEDEEVEEEAAEEGEEYA
jgi:hypothetical protein